MGRFELRRGCDGWPERLDALGDSVATLRGVGDPEVLLEPMLAVVGARRATPYGLAAAEMAGRVAAECGVVVVSGGAMGCDSAGLAAALDAGGRVVIVAGTGADLVYPSTSSEVFRRAAAGGGAVVSLEAWGAPPRRYCFPRRNRVIAALCSSLLVVEAGVPSGTLGTAEVAASLGRDVYSVPGSIFSPSSRGTNQLLEQGASVIADETALEVKISLDFGASRIVTDDAAPDRGRVLSALVACPSRPDELAARLGVDVLTMVRTLSDYETRGLACRLPDGRYSPTEAAYLARRGRAPRDDDGGASDGLDS